MVYPAPFHRLVIIGNLYADIFNTTLSIIPVGGSSMPAVTQTLCDNLAAAVRSWWQDTAQSTLGGGIDIIPAAIMTGIKLNRIGVNGRYQDPVTVEKEIAHAVGGGSAAFLPAQLSLASTLRGADERAHAGKGRMYFPPTNAVGSGMGSDGRVGLTAATAHAAGTATLMSIVNDVYLTAGVNAVAGIASKSGTGAFQTVETITVGRVPDTMRSRRNKQVEEPVIFPF